MSIKSLIFILLASLIGINADSNQKTVRDFVSSYYGNNLVNFKRALSYVNQLNGREKLSGLQALVEIMKENDDLYSSEIVELAFNLKELKQQSTDMDSDFNNLMEKTITLLPSSLQNITSCFSLKLYQTTSKGYLYADPKYVWNVDRRYAFADGNFNHISSTWYLARQGDLVWIRNVFYEECLYPKDDIKTAVTWIPGSCNSQMYWAIELVYATNFVKFRNNMFNEYLYLSEDFVHEKRILKTAPNPKNSYWEIHCAY